MKLMQKKILTMLITFIIVSSFAVYNNVGIVPSNENNDIQTTIALSGIFNSNNYATVHNSQFRQILEFFNNNLNKLKKVNIPVNTDTANKNSYITIFLLYSIFVIIAFVYLLLIIIKFIQNKDGKKGFYLYHF